MHVSMWMGVPVHTRKSRSRMSGSYLCQSLSYCSRQGLFLNWKPAVPIMLAGQQAFGICVSLPPNVRTPGMHSHVQLLGCWGFELRTSHFADHAFLPTEPSL